MSKIKQLAIDSMVLIYLIDGNETFSAKIEKYFENAERVIFSSFGLGEILAGFEKINDMQGKLGFLSFIESYKKISVVGFGKQEALIFAELRSKYPSIKPPDAIHLATAISARVDAFVTNDKKLETVKEINVLTLSK